MTCYNKLDNFSSKLVGIEVHILHFNTCMNALLGYNYSIATVTIVLTNVLC